MMITILAPAKRMEVGAPAWAGDMGGPFYKEKTRELVEALRGVSVDEMKSLMKVSDGIAENTVASFRDFSFGVTGTPALFAYRGDAYQGIDAESLSAEAVAWADDRLRILSGLYGALSPMTGVEPYRLEMGLSLPGFGVLSGWWKPAVTEHLESLMPSDGALLNLASGEYAKAVDKKVIRAKGRFVDVAFKEKKGDALKAVAIHAKRARGAMARWIIENRIDGVADVKGFDVNGYRLDGALSTENSLVFVRDAV
ncbi:YaaA family protein [Desulfoluna spongiiphila]|nr:YaaA family protein [Desulfoluna spongiiphila]